jgi:hypothetical protein
MCDFSGPIESTLSRHPLIIPVRVYTVNPGIISSGERRYVHCQHDHMYCSLRIPTWVTRDAGLLPVGGELFFYPPVVVLRHASPMAEFHSAFFLQCALVAAPHEVCPHSCHIQAGRRRGGLGGFPPETGDSGVLYSSW